MALTEETTIGLLSLLITAVIALGTLISCLLRQHNHRKISRAARRQQDLEDGVAANDAQPSRRHEPQSSVSVPPGTTTTRSLGATEPPSTAEVMLATLFTSPVPSTAASDLTASQAVTSAPSAPLTG